MSSRLIEKNHDLWESGTLDYKLKGIQKDFHKHITNNSGKKTKIVLASRRIGKSYTLLLSAIETCIKTPNTIVKYICPEERMVSTVIRPILMQILEDCPEYLKCTWDNVDKCYKFPNESKILISGSGVDADKLKEGCANLLIIDEAAFCKNLTNIINSTMNIVNCTLIMASTPNPKNIDNEFHTKFVNLAEADGTLLKITIHDSPFLTDTNMQRLVNRYVGKENDPTFRCEYLCEIPNYNS